MAFVNFWLILGGLLVGIPVILHLVMRRKPKQLVFPAVRLIKQRRASNRRKLQLRHLLLLLLRCLAIAVLALALMRPSVSSALLGNWIIIAALGGLFAVAAIAAAMSWFQKRGAAMVGATSALASLLFVALAGMLIFTLARGASAGIGDEEAPVAAVVIVDTSPRMEYQHENRTRLDAARETAVWLLDRLPRDSQVAVVDARAAEPVFAVDEAAARKAVDMLQPTSVSLPLPEVLRRAMAAVHQSELERREVYVLTDLTRQSWKAEPGQIAALQRELEAKDVALYVVDVGVPGARNFAVTDVTLPAGDVLPQSGMLEVAARVSGTGEGSLNVELMLETPDPTLPVLRNEKLIVPPASVVGQQTVSLAAGASREVRFTLNRTLQPGVHQAYVQIQGDDGLPIDDVRHFTVEVKPAWPVLVAAPPGTRTTNLTEALAPYPLRQRGAARFECTDVRQNDLANRRLEDFSVVALVDPAPLTPEVWQRLADYVRGGGGLAVFLGHNARPITSFNAPEAQQVLPGTLAWLVGRSDAGDLYLAPRTYDHTVLAKFRSIASSVPWREMPVYRYFVFDELAADSRTILPYSNLRPALIERQLGQGSVLVMTTPVSDANRTVDPQSWNDLPTADNAWPYVVLVNEMFGYLAGSGTMRLNYLAGETVVLPNREGRDPPQYTLFTPLGQPQAKSPADGRISVAFTDSVGAYRLKGIPPVGDGGPIVRGFAVNLPAETTDLTRADSDRLDEVLGADRYRLAQSRDQIEREQGESRVGREFYSFLLIALAVLLALEHLLANRFYRAEKTAETVAATESRWLPTGGTALGHRTATTQPPVAMR